ncbi:hypothetical protein ACA910_004435 [Epithemia clementina (nom. ined.)]
MVIIPQCDEVSLQSTTEAIKKSIVGLASSSKTLSPLQLQYYNGNGDVEDDSAPSLVSSTDIDDASLQLGSSCSESSNDDNDSLFTADVVDVVDDPQQRVGTHVETQRRRQRRRRLVLSNVRFANEVQSIPPSPWKMDEIRQQLWYSPIDLERFKAQSCRRHRHQATTDRRNRDKTLSAISEMGKSYRDAQFQMARAIALQQQQQKQNYNETRSSWDSLFSSMAISTSLSRGLQTAIERIGLPFASSLGQSR